MTNNLKDMIHVHRRKTLFTSKLESQPLKHYQDFV